MGKIIEIHGLSQKFKKKQVDDHRSQSVEFSR